jgi:thioredoxin reductase
MPGPVVAAPFMAWRRRETRNNRTIKGACYVSFDYDAIIIGGGPAGLSGALVLGRSRRHVLVCDTGRPRNAATEGVHSFITRNGIAPFELLRIAREELAPYDVTLRNVAATDIELLGKGFRVSFEEGEPLTARTVMLATGVRDEIPEIEGIGEMYGRSVHHCPYCDGWESREKAIAVHGNGGHGLGLALSMKTWTDDLVLCTDGPARLTARDRKRLARHGILVREECIARLEGRDGMLERIVFVGGDFIERESMFFSAGQHQGCDLARRLECRFTKRGAIWTNRNECSSIPGLYIAGDASRDTQLVIIAAAEGAKAAVAMNTAMQREERE